MSDPHGASLRSACALEHPPAIRFEFPAAGGKPVVVWVPSDPKANLDFRRELLDRADADPAVAEALRAMVETPTADGFLFWLTAFGYTYVQDRTLDDGKRVSVTDGGADVAWIPYPIQFKLAKELIWCIENGKNVAVDKSRKMGLTWLIVAVFVWMFLYRRDVNFLVMSYVEELVDNAEDPDSIFWKADYLIKSLPAFLVPRLRRTRMRLVNLDLRSTFVGKSTTAKKGRGGRKTASFLDEAAMMENLKAIWVSMRHTTPCMIANSTPMGPGYFSKLVRAKNVHQLKAPWWDHPVQGRGRYEVVNERGEIEIRSPYYDRMVEEAVDPMEISQEMNMDHRGSGYVVFPDIVLNRQRSLYVQPAWYVGEIEYDQDIDVLEPIMLRRGRHALEAIGFNDEAADPHWKLWIEFEKDQLGLWRPPQNRTYCFGIDIAWGLARANSTIVVKDIETGEQVGTYANAKVEPTEFARIAARAGYWWGGAQGMAFMCWEANGAGQNFGNEIMRLKYPWKYYNRDESVRGRKRSTKFGWHSNPHRKQLLAGILRSGMAKGSIQIRDADIIDELADYIFDEDGTIRPSDLVDESAAATATHGDRAIGAMLAEYASRECFRCKPPEREAPFGSPAWRRERAKQGRSADKTSRFIRAMQRA